MVEVLTRRCPVCGLEYGGDLPGVCARPTCGVGLVAGPGGRPRAGTLRLADHFSLCVLPFSFAEAEGPPLWLRLAESGRWQERVFSPDDPDDVDRTEYFLPYVRRFLFPGLDGAAPHRCHRYAFDLGRLGPTGPGGLALTLHAHDGRKGIDLACPLTLEEVELIAFAHRVGFLVLQFRHAEAGATYFEQMDALAYLRALAPLYRGFEMPALAWSGQRCRMPELLAGLLAEFGAAPAPGALPVKPAYDDRMMVYAFSCLAKESAPADAGRCESLLRRAAVVGLDPGPTTGPEGGDWLRSRWRGFSKDGGLLVVFDADRFHGRFLGPYQRTYYFDVFLLAALQRVTLLTLFESFADVHALTTGGGRGRKLLRRVRRDLLRFKNQCWFSQITNREQGLVLWRRWQRVFENRALLREVNDQSEELDNYLQARHRERVEWLVRLGGFLAAAVPAVFGLEQFLGQRDWVAGLRWALLGLLAVGTTAFGWLVLLRPDDDA